MNVAEQQEFRKKLVQLVVSDNCNGAERALGAYPNTRELPNLLNASPEGVVLLTEAKSSRMAELLKSYGAASQTENTPNTTWCEWAYDGF